MPLEGLASLRDDLRQSLPADEYDESDFRTPRGDVPGPADGLDEALNSAPELELGDEEVLLLEANEDVGLAGS